MCRKKTGEDGRHYIQLWGGEVLGEGQKNRGHRKNPRSSPSPGESRNSKDMKERKQLRKQWRKVTEVEKKGLEALQAEVKQCLAMLQRAE